MVISIGGLWDRPVPVDDEGLLPPSYSDHVLWESENFYQSCEEYDTSDSLYFKNLFSDPAEINLEYNWPAYSDPLPEMKDGKEVCPKVQSKNLSNTSITKQDALIRRIPMNSESPKCDSICPHTSKALRVRSLGSKDRHSKVSTSTGLRDTRVRLSISTALQFFDVQQRLGFDHSSKVVDWLMSKAQVAIDELPHPHISKRSCPLCNSVPTSTDHHISANSEPKPKNRYPPADLTYKSPRNVKEKNPVNAPPTNKCVALPNDVSVFHSPTPSRFEWLIPKSAQSTQTWWFQQTK